MKSIHRPSTIDLAATALRDEIEAGQLSGKLPGTRILAQRLGVSAPTIAAAMARLAHEGLLLKPGARHAYQVAESHRQKPGRIRTRKLLILTPHEPALLAETTRQLIQALCLKMLGLGWQVDRQVVDYLHVKHPQRAWDRMIATDEDTWVIAVHGRGPLAEWALLRKVRMFFLGGANDNLAVPMVGVSTSQVLGQALNSLTASGHWKIVIPLCDRPKSFASALQIVTQRAIEAAGHQYIASYHNPESEYLNPDVTARIIESAFARDAPTALVFIDWNELLTAYCVLSRMKLSVPEDVSLVLLSDHSEAGWFHPTLSRFRFPERRLLSTMVAWLEGHLDVGQKHFIPLPADFIKGRTIVPPGARK